MCEGDCDGVLVLLRHFETLELVSPVRLGASGGVLGDLGEVIEHACLIDDQVRELADAGLVVRWTGGPNDPRRVLRVRLPEGHLADAVRLGDDPLREPEGLERFHTAGLNAVGLADLKPTRTPLDEGSHDVRKLCQLGGCEHSCRSCADDQDIHLVGQIGRAVDSHSCGRGDSWVAGDVPVVVKLHCFPLLDSWADLCRLSEVYEIIYGCIAIATPS